MGLSPKTSKRDPKELRYAAFGTSVTWGSTLSDREKSAYVKVLSPKGVNLGIRGTGPNYPSACTQSMVGDEVFDVIILEFHVVLNFGLRTLTKRLRERFPDAIIIILREWFPQSITDKNGVTAHEWVEKRFGKKKDINDLKMHEAFRKSAGTWSWPAQDKQRNQIQNEIAREFDAYILAMPKPQDPRNWVSLSNLFSNDFLHKSKKGHEEVAKRVQNLVKSLNVPANPKIVRWSSFDSCNTWFETGKVSDNVRTSPIFKMMSFPGSEKFALEFGGEKGSNGTISVLNKSKKKWMKVYLSYMVTAPAPSKYPKMKVSIFKSDQPPVILDQVGPGYYGNMPVHVHVIKQIGMLQPGRTVLEFEQLEDAEWPFRFVSVALTNQDLKFSMGESLEMPTSSE
eukprot:CAMPEP_0172489462 /NCGR_PEP_ID=MMETSP1066-20121228/19481_1 /TAXON_ID=671091 /ORGANISM="Coscinodiscus wailesii, Strain CCMP2513" /LENGTH=396 /DNA_ID=CAMNT_0013257353 /DNA_START=253 /DNA_END=1443 /DNA_ORIENTATION=-